MRSQSEAIDLRAFGGSDLHSSTFTGVRALMLAILEDGIRSYFSPVARIRDEAELWVASRRYRSPFSFSVVCETLGLEPEAVASALGRMRADGVSGERPMRRSRPNVRRTGRLRTRRR